MTDIKRIPRRIEMIDRNLWDMYWKLDLEPDREKRAILKQRINLTERKRVRLEQLMLSMVKK